VENASRQSVDTFVPFDLFKSLVTEVLSGMVGSEEMVAAMLEAYRGVEKKQLLNGGKGFIDHRSDNDLPLNVAGLEVIFTEARHGPAYLGALRAEGSRDDARQQWVRWWRSNLRLVAKGKQDQDIFMRTTSFWGCGPDCSYPWLRTLAVYWTWQLIHLHLAYSFKDAYNAAVFETTACICETQIADIVETQVRSGVKLLCLQECTPAQLDALRKRRLLAQFDVFTPANSGESHTFSVLLLEKKLQGRQIHFTDEHLMGSNRFVAVSASLPEQDPVVFACFHCPSGGGPAIVDMMQRLVTSCEKVSTRVVLAGDTNVCPSFPGKPRKSELTYGAVLENLLKVVGTRQSVSRVSSGCFGVGPCGLANTCNKTRWIGSTQSKKVNVVDKNPKDHIFLPAEWYERCDSTSVWFVPEVATDYMGKSPSDHLGVGCTISLR
jgi:hypothetical protein